MVRYNLVKLQPASDAEQHCSIGLACMTVEHTATKGELSPHSVTEVRHFLLWCLLLTVGGQRNHTSTAQTPVHLRHGQQQNVQPLHPQGS